MLANLNSDERVHVLVVEDEPLSRIYASNLVEDAGFVPIQAADADEAISILEARKDIRIVFTDINLPGSMDGLKLAHAIRHRWPPIELILTSGHFNLKIAIFLNAVAFSRSLIVTRRLFPLSADLLPSSALL